MLCLGVALLSGCGPDRSLPPRWPERFMIVQRKVVDQGVPLPQENATTVTYYDYPRGANLIQISPDSNNSDVLWDLELDSHQSYYFTPTRKTCFPMHFPVGILRPDWLANATFLGLRDVAGRKALAWTKQDFIDYYADPVTCEPVSWYFHSMKASFHTVLYVPNAAVPQLEWYKPPSYCPDTSRGPDAVP